MNKMILWPRRTPKEETARRINGSTLEEVVKEYLKELDNPAPDFTMRQIYRRWMGEFVNYKKES